MWAEGGNPMADEWQLALLKRSVEEWNEWIIAKLYTRPDLDGADLRGANLSGVILMQPS